MIALAGQGRHPNLDRWTGCIRLCVPIPSRSIVTAPVFAANGIEVKNIMPVGVGRDALPARDQQWRRQFRLRPESGIG